MADEILPPLGTGCIATTPELRSSFGLKEGYTGSMVPKSEWRSTQAMKPHIPRGKCQGVQPSCNLYTTGKAYQTKYSFMTGGRHTPQVSYSAQYQEETRGNFSVGTMPASTIKVMAQKGFYPVVPGLPEWFNEFTRIPSEATQKRHLYRADEWEAISTLDELMSALLNNDPVNAGIHWYRGDANPGPSGELVVNPGGKHGGHSVLFYGIEMGYKHSPMGIGIWFNNHHGDSLTPANRDERGRELRFPAWGADGFGVVPVERLIEGMPLYGAWALRTVMIQDEHLTQLPEPKFGTSEVTS